MQKCKPKPNHKLLIDNPRETQTKLHILNTESEIKWNEHKPLMRRKVWLIFTFWNWKWRKNTNARRQWPNRIKCIVAIATLVVILWWIIYPNVMEKISNEKKTWSNYEEMCHGEAIISDNVAIVTMDASLSDNEKKGQWKVVDKAINAG